MNGARHAPGPWWTTESGVRNSAGYVHLKMHAQRYEGQDERYAKDVAEREANELLFAAAPELLEALKEGRRAIGGHHAPDDCYATGPMTGDPIRDLVECPACSFIGMFDRAIAKATGQQGGGNE